MLKLVVALIDVVTIDAVEWWIAKTAVAGVTYFVNFIFYFRSFFRFSILRFQLFFFTSILEMTIYTYFFFCCSFALPSRSRVRFYRFHGIFTFFSTTIRDYFRMQNEKEKKIRLKCKMHLVCFVLFRSVPLFFTTETYICVEKNVSRKYGMHQSNVPHHVGHRISNFEG